MNVLHHAFSIHRLTFDLVIQILFVSLYKSFTNLLMERLPPVSDNGDLPKLRPEKIDVMSVDLEEPPSMEVDHDNGQKDDR